MLTLESAGAHVFTPCEATSKYLTLEGADSTYAPELTLVVGRLTTTVSYTGRDGTRRNCNGYIITGQNVPSPGVYKIRRGTVLTDGRYLRVVHGSELVKQEVRLPAF